MRGGGWSTGIRHRGAAVVLSLSLASVLLGCTGDDQPDAKPAPEAPTSTAPMGTAPEGSKAVVPDAVARPLVRKLGCTITVAATGGGIGGPWIDQSLDCYRSNRFVARVHTYRPNLSDDLVRKVRGAFTARSVVFGTEAQERWCGPMSPGVVVRERWILVVPDEADAPATAERTGGTVLPPVDVSGPIPSYILPLECDEDP